MFIVFVNFYLLHFINPTFSKFKLNLIIKSSNNLVLSIVAIKNNDFIDNNSCDNDRIIKNLSETQKFLSLKTFQKYNSFT